MATNTTTDIISVLLAIFGIFLFFSAFNVYQQTKVLDYTTIILGLLIFGGAYYLSRGKR